MPARRLLTVTRAHALGRHGLWLDPPVPVGELTDVPFCAALSVEVRMPAGTTRKAEARIDIARRNPLPEPILATVVLRGIQLENVLPGSEVWLLE